MCVLGKPSNASTIYNPLLFFTFSFLESPESARSSNEGSSSLPWACSEPTAPTPCLLEAASPTSLAPGMGFTEDKFSIDQGLGDGFGMVQVQYIYCAHYFYYYCINFTHSDHQALDLEAGDPALGHQECVRASQNPLWTSHFQDILPRCLTHFLFALAAG